MESLITIPGTGDHDQRNTHTGRQWAKASEKAAKTDAEAEALFKEWASSVAAIEAPGARSRQRLEADAAKLNAAADELVRRLDDTIRSAHRKARRLRAAESEVG